MSQSPMLRVKTLTSHYGRIEALHGVDLDIPASQIVALVGANGAGKTTLLRTISGVQRVSSGSVEFIGKDITRASTDHRVRLGICQVPEGRQVFTTLSVEDNVRLGAYTRRDDDVALDMKRMYDLFPILKEYRQLPAGALSGGQQQMLAMARALMGRPKLLLLDEPSMGLAPMIVADLFQTIRHLCDNGLTIFLVEQNAQAALRIADTGYVIETGRVTMGGTGEQLLNDETVQAAYLGM